MGDTRRRVWPRELTVWAFLALLGAILLTIVVIFVAVIGDEFKPPCLLAALLVIGVPLLIGLIVEIATTAANQARLSRLRSLAQTRQAHAQWVIVADWWDAEALLRLNVEVPARPVLHYSALLTDDGLEIWHGKNRLAQLQWSRIVEVRASSRDRLSAFEKLQQGEEVLRSWGEQTRDTQWHHVRQDSRRGSVTQPVVEITVVDVTEPIALSVTGRNPLGPRTAAQRRVDEVVSEMQSFVHRS